MENRKAVDWERIEFDYRSGILSLREIASQYEISHQAIAKKAKANGWERDLGAKIKARAEALVAKQSVDTEVDSRRAATEREVIEANAARIAQVRGEHRSDISRARALSIQMLGELEIETDGCELFKQLGTLLHNPDDKGMDKLNEIYHKVISLPTRIESVKKLAETLKNLIGLEREAYGLESAPSENTASAITQITRRIVRAAD